MALHLRIAAAALVILAACGSNAAPGEAATGDHRSLGKNERELDLVELRTALSCGRGSAPACAPEQLRASRIESIRIEPLDHDDARYVVTRKDMGRRFVAYGPFPGDLVDAIDAASVMYEVRPDDMTESAAVAATYHTDATSFRHAVRCSARPAPPNCGGRDRTIERVHIAPHGHGSATYIAKFTNPARVELAYAEYPGRILDELKAAGVRYEIVGP